MFYFYILRIPINKMAAKITNFAIIMGGLRGLKLFFNDSYVTPCSSGIDIQTEDIFNLTIL